MLGMTTTVCAAWRSGKMRATSGVRRRWSSANRIRSSEEPGIGYPASSASLRYAGAMSSPRSAGSVMRRSLALQSADRTDERLPFLRAIHVRDIDESHERARDLAARVLEWRRTDAQRAPLVPRIQELDSLVANQLPGEQRTRDRPVDWLARVTREAGARDPWLRGASPAVLGEERFGEVVHDLERAVAIRDDDANRELREKCRQHRIAWRGRRARPRLCLQHTVHGGALDCLTGIHQADVVRGRYD